jgi:hypothetical protein
MAYVLWCQVMIKSVAQAIPTYIMVVFKLPNTLCEEMEQMILYSGVMRKEPGKCTG